MSSHVEKLLNQVLANQVIIYKRLEEIEGKIKGGTRAAPIDRYFEELKEKADKVLPYIRVS